MKRKKRGSIVSFILSVIFIVVIFALGFLSHSIYLSITFGFNSNKVMVEAADAIEKYYFDDVADFKERFVYPAIKTMVNRLDEHSHFFTPSEAARMAQMNKSYKGLGISYGYKGDVDEFITKKGDAITLNDVNSFDLEIKEVFENSPALKVGLKPRDVLLKVNGILVAEMETEKINNTTDPKEKFSIRFEIIQHLILSDEDDLIELVIKRNGKIKEFQVKKEEIKIKNVKWKIIKSGSGNIGYLKIKSFMPTETASDTEQVIDNFKEKGVKGIILDLRGNHGGSLKECVGVLENFLPSSTLVMEMRERASNGSVYTSRSYSNYLELPIVALVNEESASASEVVVGALLDYKKAIIIGKKTYGKGCTGVRLSLSDGSEITVTHSMYYLPAGENIHKKGIKPHIKMDTIDDEKLIMKAKEILLDWENYKKEFLD